MALTDSAIRAAAARDKPFKLGDAGGLYLLVNPGGSKLWRMKYRFNGREKLLALGSYPLIGLKQAREKRAVDNDQYAVCAQYVPSPGNPEEESRGCHEDQERQARSAVVPCHPGDHRWPHSCANGGTASRL
ncbi:MAG: DUF4102 domain-containing protein [Acetobacteraceae bacterium]|nr:MAG: DUF4102 domain-containing protein [Acetobacteraceae bacterium]